MKKVTTLLLVALMSVGTLAAQSVDEIAANYVNAIGGASKWKALKSTKSILTMNTQGFDLPGSVTREQPNKQRIEFDFNGTKIVQAYDGTTAWWINPTAGVNEAAQMPEAQAKGFKENDFLNNYIDYKSRGISLELLGEEDVEGKSCYKVKLTNKEGTEEINFFDKESNLLVMRSVTSTAAGFEQTVETHFSDYAEVSGLMFAMKFQTKSAGQVLQTFTISEVELNVETSAEEFAYPGN